METFEEIKKVWCENKFSASVNESVSSAFVNQIIAKQMKKEKRVISNYFWASFFYQNLVYGFLTFLALRYMSRTDIVFLSILGIVIYIPFTILFMRKFSTLFHSHNKESDFSNENIAFNIENTHRRLLEFFRFKKVFDWIAVPVSCFVIVSFTFILYVPGGIEANPVPVILLFFVWLGLFVIAIRIENKRTFIGPLHELKSILDELKQ